MKKFEDDLHILHQRLDEMAVRAKAMVELIRAAVKDRHRQIREELMEHEKILDQTQMEVDREAIRIMTIYGPVASALRDLLVVTHVTAQLERMGDQCINVYEAVELMSSDPDTHPIRPSLKQMADLVAEMVDDALDAFFRKDPEKAKTTRSRDDLADAMNDQIMKELLTDEILREVLSGAVDIADAVAQVLIARHLERIADQATNICKEVVYLVEGEDVRHSPKP